MAHIMTNASSMQMFLWRNEHAYADDMFFDRNIARTGTCTRRRFCLQHPKLLPRHGPGFLAKNVV